MMKKLCMIMASIVVIFYAVSANAGWLIYSKPEFRGRVIDAETKEPIAGAVVVVMYWAEQVIGGPGGQSSSIVDAKEILTDAKGEFFFPDFTTIINPLYKEDFVEFIIYKPSYLSSDGPENIKVPVEYFFTTDVVGKEVEIKHYSNSTTSTWRGPIGILELKKGDGTGPNIHFDYRSNKLPLLFKAINEDRKRHGLKGEFK